jgi:hypothetical protein
MLTDQFISGTFSSYLHTVPVRDVVLLKDVSDYTDVTTQIWGKDFLGRVNLIFSRKSSFFWIDATLAGIALLQRCVPGMCPTVLPFNSVPGISILSAISDFSG